MDVDCEKVRQLQMLAPDREAQHVDHASCRPLSDGYEDVGMAGEFAFGAMCGFFPDVTLRPGGDNGFDFTVPVRMTVDVKCARKAYNLIHEANTNKPWADIYVLARYDDETKQATLLGWEWGAKLLRAPTKDFGHGVINHYIPASSLRPMSELGNRMIRL